MLSILDRNRHLAKGTSEFVVDEHSFPRLTRHKYVPNLHKTRTETKDTSAELLLSTFFDQVKSITLSTHPSQNEKMISRIFANP